MVAALQSTHNSLFFLREHLCVSWQLAPTVNFWFVSYQWALILVWVMASTQLWSVRVEGRDHGGQAFLVMLLCRRKGWIGCFAAVKEVAPPENECGCFQTPRQATEVRTLHTKADLTSRFSLPHYLNTVPTEVLRPPEQQGISYVLAQDNHENPRNCWNCWKCLQRRALWSCSEPKLHKTEKKKSGSF